MLFDQDHASIAAMDDLLGSSAPTGWARIHARRSRRAEARAIRSSATGPAAVAPAPRQSLAPRFPEGSRGVAYHAPAIGFLVLFAAVLLRAYIGTGIPAGTDTLGFIARARESSRGGLTSAWAPSGFGAPRTFTLEQLLGVITVFTKNAVLTYKLVTFALVMGAAMSAYCLAWRLSRSRAVSALAGFLYASSPIVLAQWGSGHLNVQVVIALLPAQLLLWIQALEGFRLRRALLLGLCFGLLMLDRPDMILLSAATLFAYFALCLLSNGNVRRTVRNAAKTGAVVGVTALALDAYQLVPAVAGVRASWLSSKSLFDVSQLTDHSVSASQSLAGFAQETGYFGYSHLPTSSAHPWLPYGIYVAVALAVPLLALAVLRARRGTLVVRLLCLGLLADFIAKGVRHPLGGLYSSALDLFHPLTNFRDPNRWLLVQALSFAILASMAAAAVVPRLVGARRGQANHRVARGGAFVIVGALLSLSSLPVITRGFSTYQLTPGQRQLMGAVREQKGDYVVSSVPYGAAYRFVDSNGYRGYEHDLGSESAFFTNKPAVGSGDWGARGAAFVAYTHELLKRHDPAFSRLLSANNVGYLLALNDPAIADRYTTNGAGAPNLATDPFGDRRAASNMAGLKKIAGNDDGTLYAVAAPSPIVTARPNVATILGGDSGLAAFADTPGLDVSRWAPITAGDLIDHGGLSELARVMRASQVVYIADTSVTDLALASAKPLARLDGQLVGTAHAAGGSALAKTGQLVTQADNDSATRNAESKGTYIGGGDQTTEIWIRAQLSATPAKIEATVDGRKVGSALPLSATTSGFTWIQLYRGKLSPGKHAVSISAFASDFGASANLTQSVVVSSAARQRAEADVRSLLASEGSRLIYASDPAVQGRAADPATITGNAAAVRFSDNPLWLLDDTAHTDGAAIRDSERGTVTGITSPGERTFFTIAHHDFDSGQDWSKNAYLLVDFFGQGAGADYEINVFDARTARRVRVPFVDDHRGWRTLAIRIDATAAPVGFSWSRVGSIGLASESKVTTFSIRLGRARLAADPTTAPVDLELAGRTGSGAISLASASGRDCGAFDAPTAGRGSTRRIEVNVSISAVRAHCRVMSGATVAAAPLQPVHVVRQGRTKYQVSFTLKRPSVISFSRSFDSGWKLQTPIAESRDHLPVFALVNGYMLPAGTYTATLEFSGDRVVPIGAGMSIAALVIVLMLLFLTPVQRAVSAAPASAALWFDADRDERERTRRRAILRIAAWLLSGVVFAGAVFAATRGDRWLSAVGFGLAAALAPLPWKVHWAIALVAIGEVAVGAVVGRTTGADGFAIIAVLIGIRAIVPMLVAPEHTDPAFLLDDSTVADT